MPTKKKRVYNLGALLYASVCSSPSARVQNCLRRIVCTQNCVCAELCVLRIMRAQNRVCSKFEVPKFLSFQV